MESQRKYKPTKLNIFNYLIIEQSELFNFEVHDNFFYDYNEIKKLQESQKQSDFLKILNFNKKKVNSILYEKDKIINIDDKKIEKIFPYIYLCILIEDNIHILNYIYDFELINKLNNEQTKETDNHLKKILISKMINILITYKDNKFKMNKVNKIEDENKKVIKDNIGTLKLYNLNEKDIYQKQIEEIYLEIIKTLIKKQNFDEDKIRKLEFESISFFDINEINKIIDKKEEYIKKYEISEFYDLFSDYKITFYYILIKYIFKHPFFIYQNKFLNETRKTIIKLIIKNIDLLYSYIEGINDRILKEKIEYVLKSFFEYRYYYEKSKSKYNSDNNKSNTNLSNNPFSNSSFKKAQFQSNKSFNMRYTFEDSRIDKDDLALRVLKKSKFKLHINKKGKEAIIIYDNVEVGDNGDKKQIDDIKNYRSKNTKLNDKYDIFLKRLTEMENQIRKDIENGNNLAIVLEFSADDSTNSEIDYIDRIETNCEYKTENPQNSEIFKDDNILSEKWSKNGLSYFIDSLN